MTENGDEMMMRHKSELRDLEGKVRALLKTAKKSNKAEIEAEAIRMGYDLKAKQTAEWDNLSDEATLAAATQTESMRDRDVAEIAAAAADDEHVALQKKAKGLKKKEKKLTKDKERQLTKESIDCQAGPSFRQVELDLINNLLLQEDLTVKVVPSDGHCLYRAIADQLNTTWLFESKSHPEESATHGQDKSQHSFISLRALAAGYLRSHAEEFAPFLGMMASDIEYIVYCNKVESVSDAEWGGQLEISALCACLNRRIIVVSADAPAVVMGDDNAESRSRHPLKIAYHKHYYALGEHYNSVTPIDKPCPCCEHAEKQDST